MLQESGFGVTFPNFIVDVQKDADGKYSEAVQFQCLERGGVRIFEGINFLSRSPTMSPEQLAAMHARATAAGMDPYGSAPEQMHYVPHTKAADFPVENSWQVARRRARLGRAQGTRPTCRGVCQRLHARRDQLWLGPPELGRASA